MFSKVLKCIIAFYIISFCDSAPTESPCELGTYNELLLVQHLTKDHGWVVSGLWGLSDEDRLLTNCVDYFGTRLSYSNYILEAIIQIELEKRWPALTPNQTEDDLWELEYDKYGSCIEDDPSNYYAKAIYLYDDKPVKKILNDAGIHPGSISEYNHLVKSINNTLGRDVFVKCVEDEETQQQHLSDITLCFNAAHDLISCRGRHPEHTEIHQCETDKAVYYPEFHVLSEQKLTRPFTWLTI